MVNRFVLFAINLWESLSCKLIKKVYESSSLLLFSHFHFAERYCFQNGLLKQRLWLFERLPYLPFVLSFFFFHSFIRICSFNLTLFAILPYEKRCLLYQPLHNKMKKSLLLFFSITDFFIIIY